MVWDQSVTCHKLVRSEQEADAEASCRSILRKPIDVVLKPPKPTDVVLKPPNNEVLKSTNDALKLTNNALKPNNDATNHSHRLGLNERQRNLSLRSPMARLRQSDVVQTPSPVPGPKKMQSPYLSAQPCPRARSRASPGPPPTAHPGRRVTHAHLERTRSSLHGSLVVSPVYDAVDIPSSTTTLDLGKREAPKVGVCDQVLVPHAWFYRFAALSRFSPSIRLLPFSS